MNGCEMIKCGFYKDGKCTDQDEFVNRYGEPVCRYRGGAIPKEITAKLHIKNQLNGGLTIEFCSGQNEYVLAPGKEATIEVQDEDCMYFDIVRE